MSKIVATTHVWLREMPFEAGTEFDVVDAPKAATDIDPTTAARWSRQGWAKDAEAKAKADK